MKRTALWTAKEGSEQGPADEAQPQALPLAAPIALADLERAVRDADPTARVIPARVLRRVVREHTALGGFGLRVPHSKCYTIRREPLLEIADQIDLGCAPDEPFPETVVLLERPSHEELAETPAEVVLTRMWRLLFHARVHLALDARAAGGALGLADVRRRIEQLGRVEFEEVGNVLRQERMLLPPADQVCIYVEFAATWLELRHFAPGLLPNYFPALESQETVQRVLGQDVDAEALLLATRPAGAADAGQSALQHSSLPVRVDESSPNGQAGAVPAPQTPAFHVRPRRRGSKRKYRSLDRRASAAAAAGNHAGAAIRRAKAESWAPREATSEARAAVRNDVHRLVDRLQAALAIPDQDLPTWRETLLALAQQTPRGIWTVEARMLHDLQKVCVDHERGVYRVDLVEWLLSWGKRPIKRPLPSQREVAMAKHLRSAQRRLAAVRITQRQRQQLSALLGSVAHRAEQRLRDHLRPKLAKSLDDADLRPQNLPERVAKKKLIEELLDQIVDRGYLRLGDLRDALSRSNLKQPDCSGPLGLLRGDALLRTNRRLALALDGVYERGEFYLRWLQRFSSLAFGTRVGRFLTRYLAVPFGGAFLVLAGIDEMAALIAGHNPELAGIDEIVKIFKGQAPDPSRVLNVPALGLLLLGLLYVGWFRRGVARVMRAAGRAVRIVLVDGVRWFVRLPLVQKVLNSRAVRMGFRFMIKPLVPTVVVWQVLHPEVSGWETTALSGAFFLAMNFALNSRFGRNFEEAAGDWIVEVWHRFGVRIITGAFWFIMDVFRRTLQVIERLLYAVDEWLQFKTGESRTSLVLKAVLSVVWFLVTYVVRFAVNVLLEPQINPIKHFPVVTVSHKLLFMTIPVFQDVLVDTVGMDSALALAVATTVIWCIPGIFGFLVWELKENWRLYAANRPKGLRPVQIGSHGESMVRLLRPGFHSGTVPKRFAKLRRAERKAGEEGSKAVRKHRDALDHVELAVRRWLEREFAALLAESPAWRDDPPAIGPIRLASNRIKAAVLFSGSPEPSWLSLDLESGWMLAGFSGDGRKSPLLPEAEQVLRAALAGLYKTGGVELVRRQIEAAFPSPCPPYGLSNAGLLVWPDGPDDVEVFYDLRSEGRIAPQVLQGSPRCSLPTLERSKMVFAAEEVTWEEWVAAWEGHRGRRNRREHLPRKGLPAV